MPRRGANDWLVKDVRNSKRQRVTVAEGSVTVAVCSGYTTIQYPPELLAATAQALKYPGEAVLYQFGKAKLKAMWKKYSNDTEEELQQRPYGNGTDEPLKQPPIDKPEDPEYVVVYWGEPSESARPQPGNRCRGQRSPPGWYVGRLQEERKVAGTTKVVFQNGNAFDLVDVELFEERYERESRCETPAAGAWCYLH